MCQYLDRIITGDDVTTYGAICRYYTKRALACPTCDEARELCKDWTTCTAEQYALKLLKLKELFTKGT